MENNNNNNKLFIIFHTAFCFSIAFILLLDFFLSFLLNLAHLLGVSRDRLPSRPTGYVPRHPGH